MIKKEITLDLDPDPNRNSALYRAEIIASGGSTA